MHAKYEIGFLIFKDAFKRVVPKAYTGEGKWKFAPQYVMGELQWHYEIDNDCNVFGDNGFFKYRIRRAIQAHRPHGVVAIAYKRCQMDDGFIPDSCESIPELSS